MAAKPDRVVVVIQARMGSTRLPGKTLKDLDGVPVLQHVVTRCRAALIPDEVVVATSVGAIDDVIEEFCKKQGFPCFRGSEPDVLNRMCDAARAHRADIVVRVTADCPLLSPDILDKTVVLLQVAATPRPHQISATNQRATNQK